MTGNRTSPFPTQSWILSAASEQQSEYEAALGAFLVAFNACERKATLLAHELKINSHNLATAIAQLKKLQKISPESYPADFELLDELRDFRNDVAHGDYLDHLIFEEHGALKVDYQIVTHKEGQAVFIPLEKLAARTDEARAVNDQLIRVLIGFRNKADSVDDHVQRANLAII